MAESSTRTRDGRGKSIVFEDSSTRGVGIVDRYREFVDQDGGILDQCEEWSRKIYRGVGIVVRYREFFDQNGGILDQYEEWSRRIYRVRGFIDQELKSSTGSENSTTRTRSGRGFIDYVLESSTGTENSSTRTAESSTRTKNGRSKSIVESGQSMGTPLLGSDLGSDRGILSDTDTRNDRPTVRPTDRPTDCPTDYRLFRQSAFLPFLSFTAVFRQKLMNRRGEWACLAQKLLSGREEWACHVSADMDSSRPRVGENGRVMHELTWILLGRLGGGIIILRTKYRDVPMGIDSIRLG
ncbi:putative protein [Arabidopsis thaliana]|uniref:Maternal effect embryo arrest 38 n=1 Tax=Arabidopsis thaliana TaxID=3702 RepID=Q9LXL8_ARATH|nr:maternal effect embryo arrest 38 [Arabidopsis thaliana]AEE77770.1 maternal effect embryo arrest 38 [Arabidopsis thaliana]CAB89037.1 putative protein [Arabidopsis thaliana]|eukprot:NP_189902.1 maternal effect embryo arrest 38 [Arabidopsis thaliana]